MKIARNTAWSWLIGVGIVLFAIHNPNQPLIEYAFLPQVGMMMMGIGVVVFVSWSWKAITWGDKRIWIPMLVIVASMGGSGFIQMAKGEVGFGEGFAPLVMGCLLFALYLSARSLNREIFEPFLYAVILGSLGCVICGLVNPGKLTGGIISPTNFDMATGLLVFGTVVSAVRRQWWLSTVALIGLFFMGAPEAVFSVGVVGLVVFIRRDFGKKILLPSGLLLVVAGLWFGLGYGKELYRYTAWAAGIEAYPTAGESITEPALERRWRVISEAMSDIQPLGHGYTITGFTEKTVHNVPLVIVDQIGILAAVAWLWITLFCLVKTKWRYAFTAVIALSVFDHFIWTQVAPWWWALVGVATAIPNIKGDFIFKEVRDEA